MHLCENTRAHAALGSERAGRGTVIRKLTGKEIGKLRTFPSQLLIPEVCLWEGTEVDRLEIDVPWFSQSLLKCDHE